MQIANTIKECRSYLDPLRANGNSVGFVPTMGYLHEGHLSLVREAKTLAKVVVVSIFVNPKQFNNPDDLLKYPRDFERDKKLLRDVGVDLVFIPEVDEVYPPGFSSQVIVRGITDKLEGVHRPGHFEGVSTVVSILFNSINPDFAVFGEKDFQQLRVIEQMVQDLRLSVKVVRGKTIREPDGLAMSSRNVRLSNEARGTALLLNRSLLDAIELYAKGERKASVLKDRAIKRLSDPGVSLEYLSIVSEDTLDEIEVCSGSARILVAAVVGGVRLIDNMALSD